MPRSPSLKPAAPAKPALATAPDAKRSIASLLDATSVAVLALDREFRIVYVNRRALEISHLQEETCIGKVYWDLRPEVRGTTVEENIVAAMRERVPREFEFLHPALGIWMKVLAAPWEDGLALSYQDISSRKRIEQTRDLANRRLLQVFDAAPSVVICVDRNWNVTFANWRAFEVLGSRFVVGENFLQLFPHGTSEPFVSSLRSTMEQRTPIEIEAFFPEMDNAWYQVIVRPYDEGIILFFRDITQQRHDEAALRESESRYRTLADLNPQAIWMGDPAGNITYANHRFVEYLGLTMADIDDWLVAFHPDDRQRVLESWKHSVATGEEYDTEARMIRARDGAARWWWIRARPIRDHAGAILNWLGIAVDIDDRKVIAEALLQKQAETERQRAELETIYDTAPVGLALFDPVEFRYLRVNNHQAAVIGLPKDEIIGRSVLEIAPLKGLKELMQHAASGHTIRNCVLEGELPARPDEHRYWNVNYSPICNANGDVEAITAVALEVTHQKKAENALIQSEKLAAVGRLASSISHEINNPLEAITNLLYLVSMSKDLPAGVRAYVSTAQNELSRVCQIATQTLRFHRQAVRATDITAAELVDAVLNLYQGRLANSGIRVEATYATTTRILCFENDIRQVLSNLIANAVDAMRQGGRLIIRAHDAIDQAGRKGIRLAIADTGHGMPPEVQARLFEPFYTTKDLNGTGLGLWISSEIVSRHQGRLTYRSTQHPVHHGTIFSLFLPWAEEPSPPPPRQV